MELWFIYMLQLYIYVCFLTIWCIAHVICNFMIHKVSFKDSLNSFHFKWIVEDPVPFKYSLHFKVYWKRSCSKLFKSRSSLNLLHLLLKCAFYSKVTLIPLHLPSTSTDESSRGYKTLFMVKSSVSPTPRKLLLEIWPILLRLRGGDLGNSYSTSTGLIQAPSIATENPCLQVTTNPH